MIKNIIFKSLKFYQGFISPHFGGNCRFYPSCSEYSCLAVKKYGSFKGLSLSLIRILKCQKWHPGGVDLP